MSRFDNDRDGFALVSVLLFLLVVAAVITPFILAARTDFLIASGQLNKARHQHTADGLVRHFARQVAASANEINELLKLNSEPMMAICGDNLIEVRIQDQRSLIDLNQAETELLAAGFAAAGLPASDTYDLAALAEKYRAPNSGFSDAGDDKLSDGFKYSGFEAIEELYEFPGFSNFQIQRLREVFTVYGRWKNVEADNIPASLASFLSGPQSQFVVDEDERSRFYQVAATVRSAKKRTNGFSAFLIEITNDEKAIYRVVERVFEPNVVGAGPGSFAQNMTCEELIGEDLGDWLAAV